MADLLFQELRDEFQQEIALFENGTLREAKFSSIPNKIKVAIGMRRTGKTFFLTQKIQSLLKKNIPLSQIFYLNFEDDRLLPLTQEKLRYFINEFYSLYPDNHQKKCYIFLDEIQHVEARKYVSEERLMKYTVPKVHTFLVNSEGPDFDARTALLAEGYNTEELTQFASGTPAGKAYPFKKGIAGSELVAIPEAGHMVTLEKRRGEPSAPEIELGARQGAGAERPRASFAVFSSLPLL